jgi:hypothetical protein
MRCAHSICFVQTEEEGRAARATVPRPMSQPSKHARLPLKKRDVAGYCARLTARRRLATHRRPYSVHARTRSTPSRCACGKYFLKESLHRDLVGAVPHQAGLGKRRRSPQHTCPRACTPVCATQPDAQPRLPATPRGALADLGGKAPGRCRHHAPRRGRSFFRRSRTGYRFRLTVNFFLVTL